MRNLFYILTALFIGTSTLFGQITDPSTVGDYEIVLIDATGTIATVRYTTVQAEMGDTARAAAGDSVAQMYDSLGNHIILIANLRSDTEDSLDTHRDSIVANAAGIATNVTDIDALPTTAEVEAIVEDSLDEVWTAIAGAGDAPKMVTLTIGPNNCDVGVSRYFLEDSLEKILTWGNDTTYNYVVEMQPGSYYLDGTVNITSGDFIFLMDGVELITSGSGMYAFTLDGGVNNVVFDGFDAVGTGDAYGIVSAGNVDSVELRNCTWRGFVHSSATIFDVDTLCDAWIIRDCKSTNNYKTQFNGAHSRVINFEAYSSTNTSLEINGMFNEVINPKIEVFASYGIHLTDVGPHVDRSGLDIVVHAKIQGGSIRWRDGGSKYGIYIDAYVLHEAVTGVMMCRLDTSVSLTNPITAGIYQASSGYHSTYTNNIIKSCTDGIYTIGYTYIGANIFWLCVDGVHVAGNATSTISNFFKSCTTALNIASGDKNVYGYVACTNVGTNVTDNGTNTVTGETNGVIDSD